MKVEEWHQMAMLLSRKNLDRLEKWANKNFMKLNKKKHKLLCLGKRNPRHQDMLAASQLKAALQKRTWVPAGHQLKCVSNVPLPLRNYQYPRLH